MTAKSNLFVGTWSPPLTKDPAALLLQNVCEERREAFLARWRENPAVVTYIPESNIDEIFFGSDSGRPYYGKVSPLGKVKTSDAVMVTFPGEPSFYTSLWVRNDFEGYISVYREFLELVHQVPKGGPTLGSLGYDLDHLRNKASTPPGTFIRLEAIPSGPQRAWGRKYERALSSPKFEDKRQWGTASWMTVVKVAGLHPPADWDDTKWLQELEDFNTNNSIDSKTDLMKDLVGRELERAYMHRGRRSGELTVTRQLRNQAPIFGLSNEP